MKRKYMESMKQKFFCAAVPLVMLAVSAALSVFVYRLPQPVREPLPVLMYHHMVPDGQDCNDMTVTPSKFRADLEAVLAMGYTPVLPRTPCRKSPSSSPLMTATAATTIWCTPFCGNTA